jgi:hypothetical protein
METRRSLAPRNAPSAHGPDIALAAAGAATAAIDLLAAWRLPAALILPAASLVLLAVGFALALAFWDRAAERERLSYRDVAALLVFFGFASALLSDTSAVMPLLDRAAP